MLINAVIRRLIATEKEIRISLLYQVNDFEVVSNLKNFEKTLLFTNTNYERLNIREDFDKIDFLFEYRKLIEINSVYFMSWERFMNFSLNIKISFYVMKNMQFN